MLRRYQACIDLQKNELRLILVSISWKFMHQLAVFVLKYHYYTGFVAGRGELFCSLSERKGVVRSL